MAISEEIFDIKGNLMKKGASFPVEVSSGKFIEENGNGFLYEFYTVNDLEKNITADAATSFIRKKERTKGYIEECFLKESKLYVQLEKFIGNTTSKGILQFDLTYLLKMLSDAIQKIADEPWEFHVDSIKDLFDKNWNVSKDSMYDSYDLNASQVEAVETALGSNVCLLWGPPGTGKTKTIGALVHELAEKGEKVLVASQTNIAVDTVMNGIVKYKKRYNGSYQILRYGFLSPERRQRVPNLDDLLEKYLSEKHITLKKDIDSFCTHILGKNIKEIPVRIRLKKAIQQAESKTISLKSITEGNQYKGEIDELANKILSEVDVIGTTLTKLYCDHLFNEICKGFDSVVIDEVSMANAPQIFYAAAKTRNKIILGGDFNQLPPIVQSKKNIAQFYLGRHIYKILGLDDPYHDFPVRPILDVQYRMHPDICTVVNQLFYGGRMKTSDTILRSVECWKNLEDKLDGKSSILLIDSSNTSAMSKQVGKETRRNEYHARVVVSLVEKISNKHSIGVITPYRGQWRFIRQRLYATNREFFKEYDLSVSTIHSFQGQEKDIIIFDLVDTPPMPSSFLNDYKNNSIKNLVNVALSRAKKKLIVIAHCDHFKEQLPTGIVSDLLNSLKRWGSIIQLDKYDLESLNIFMNENDNWPPTRRLFDTEIIQSKIKTPGLIKWNGEHVPVFEVETDRVKINLSRNGTDQQLWIPIYEIEAVKSAGNWKAVIHGE